MHVKIRSKINGRIEVCDHTGKPLKGIVSVDIHADGKNPFPVVRIVSLADIAIDAEVKAEIKTNEKPAEPVIQQPQPRFLDAPRSPPLPQAVPADMGGPVRTDA